MHSQQIDETITRAFKNIPLPSVTATRLIQQISREDYDLSEILETLKMDTGMTSHILRVVNSPAFSLLKPVSTLERAVIYVGARDILEISLINLTSYLKDQKLSGYKADVRDLWRHDLRTAIAARELAFMNPEMQPELAFTAGLLHDIGKVALSDFFQLSAEKHLQLADDSNELDFLFHEKKILGIDHAEAGFEIATIWKLPGSLQSSIRYHHQPSKAEKIYKPLVFLIHIADILAMMDGFGSGIDMLQYSLDTAYMDYFDFSVKDISLLQFKVEEEFQKMESGIGLGA
jgi:putative nucleotidyltransferase with HDIG domain